MGRVLFRSRRVRRGGIAIWIRATSRRTGQLSLLGDAKTRTCNKNSALRFRILALRATFGPCHTSVLVLSVGGLLRCRRIILASFYPVLLDRSSRRRMMWHVQRLRDLPEVRARVGIGTASRRQGPALQSVFQLRPPGPDQVRTNAGLAQGRVGAEGVKFGPVVPDDFGTP